MSGAAVRVALVLGLATPVAAATPDAGTPPATPAKGPSIAVTTAQAARARFERFAREQLLPTLGQERRAELGYILRNRPWVAKVACQAVHRELLESVGAAEPLLHGTAAALDRPGSCWHLAYDGQIRSGLGGCLDAASGSVLAAWRIPEG